MNSHPVVAAAHELQPFIREHLLAGEKRARLVWDLASTGADIPMKLRAQLYASRFYTADVARDTVSRLYARGTRAAFMQNHPLERALRNLHALAFAYEAVRSFQHSAGRVLLDGEPLTPIF